ncbi:MAG: TIM barrel protein [Chloroflexi bacterium]|nr:TIM barrel protein [Chloroflexota bacterium]
MPRISLTTWSIHPYLNEGSLNLLDMPARVKAAGIGTVEICHFHIPQTSPDYLLQLKAKAAEADIEIFSVLIDAYDISQADPTARAHDIAQIAKWIDVAVWIGASHVRVVGGESPASDIDALRRAATVLVQLQHHAKARGVTVITENFKATALTPASWLALHDALGHGGCADIGNFPHESRVADFAQVAHKAVSVHVKASYDDNGTIQPAQVQACLAEVRKYQSAGPLTLVYDRPGDRWQGIETLRQVVLAAMA